MAEKIDMYHPGSGLRQREYTAAQGIPGTPRFIARYDADGEIMARTFRALNSLEPQIVGYVTGELDISDRDREEGKGARVGEAVTVFQVVRDGDEVQEIPWRTYVPDARCSAGIRIADTAECKRYAKEQAERNAAKRAEIERRIGAQIDGHYGNKDGQAQATAQAVGQGIGRAIREELQRPATATVEVEGVDTDDDDRA